MRRFPIPPPPRIRDLAQQAGIAPEIVARLPNDTPVFRATVCRQLSTAIQANGMTAPELQQEAERMAAHIEVMTGYQFHPERELPTSRPSCPSID